MKHFTYILFTGSIALCVAACSKNEESQTPGTSQQKVYTIFTAVAEPLDFLSEAGIADYDFSWPESGYVGIFGSEQGDNARYTIDGELSGEGEAYLYGPEVSGEQILAYYPYQASGDSSAEHIAVSIPQEQTFVPAAEFYSLFAENSTLVGQYDPEAERIRFHYPFGCLIIDLKIDGTIRNISIMSESMKLSGNAYVDQQLHIQMASTASDRIEIPCTEPLVTSEAQPARIHLIMPPQSYPAGDLTVTISVQDNDSQQEEHFSYRISAPITVERIGSALNTVLEFSLNTDGLPEMTVTDGNGLIIYS